jgi:hypothetical protein
MVVEREGRKKYWTTSLQRKCDRGQVNNREEDLSRENKKEYSTTTSYEGKAAELRRLLLLSISECRYVNVKSSVSRLRLRNFSPFSIQARQAHIALPTPANSPDLR